MGLGAWYLQLYAFLPLFLPALFLTRLRMLLDGPSAIARLNWAGRVSLVVFFIWVEVVRYSVHIDLGACLLAKCFLRNSTRPLLPQPCADKDRCHLLH